jgi:hypothetical protein
MCFKKDRPNAMTIAINKGMERIVVLLMEYVDLWVEKYARNNSVVTFQFPL